MNDTFHVGAAGRFPGIDDSCERLEEILLKLKEAAPEAPPIQVDAGPGELAIAAIDRRDRLENRLAFVHSRRWIANGQVYQGNLIAAAIAPETKMRTRPSDAPGQSKHKRLWRKFRENPYKYLSDSKNPLLRVCRCFFKRKRK